MEHVYKKKKLNWHTLTSSVHSYDGVYFVMCWITDQNKINKYKLKIVIRFLTDALELSHKGLHNFCSILYRDQFDNQRIGNNFQNLQ